MLRFRLRTALAVLALVLFATPAFAQSMVFGPGLDAASRAALPADQPLTVIVSFEGETLQDQHLAAVRALGVNGRHFASLPMMVALATPAQIDALASLDGVRSIWPNEDVTYFNDEATKLTRVDDARNDNEFRKLNGGLPLSGKGIGVMVNDTGVDGTHADLKFPTHTVQNVQALLDPNGMVDGMLPIIYSEDHPNTDVAASIAHGTHVAGIVAGQGKVFGMYEGVAPEADIIGFGSGVARPDQLSASIYNVLAGFDYALTHQIEYNIRVINNSWGSSGTFDPNNPVNIATKRCYDRNIAVVFAAGNSGPGADTHNPYAQAPWVLSVAAGEKDGTLAGFSSRGNPGEAGTFEVDGETWTYVNEPTITAPGVGIISVRASTDILTTGVQALDPLEPATHNVYYLRLQGTSMAAPHVAGIIALMLEANPSLSVDEIRQMLVETAFTMPGRATWEVGAGYVNAYNAVARAFGLDTEPSGSIRVELELPENGVLADAEGDSDSPGTDIRFVTVDGETANDLTLSLHVDDLDQATESTLIAAGFQVGTMQEYSVEFNLVKPDAETVRYDFSAKRTLIDAGAGGVTLSGATFDYGVRAADGSGRGLGDVTGVWDGATGTITWTIPKAILNVVRPPESLTSQDIDRTGRSALTGDVLGTFGASVVTSIWGGVVGLTPGATRFDEGTGSKSYTLGGGTGDDETGGEGGSGEGGSGGEGNEGEGNTGGSTGGTPSGDAPRVVVAVIDSGTNPYHDFFQTATSAVTQDVLDAFGITEGNIIDLTRTGNFAADFAADADVWAGIQAGEPYWFRGTNVIGISFAPGTRIILPDDEGDRHGVGTSAAVLAANPEAVVVFVEGVTDASETFAFTHPAVDIVSTSYGPIGSLPLPYHVTNSYTGVVENGKLHFGASDNSPSTAVQDGTAGPWWSIGVNGFEEDSGEGRQATSGTFADFGGDFSQDLPYCAECESETRMAYGTSFATPRSAGTASKILLDLRRSANHNSGIVDGELAPGVTVWQFRRALEEAAYYPSTADYDPIEGVFDQASIPVLEAAPYALVGWGVLTTDPEHGVVAEALAHLGQGAATRFKDAETCTFMTGLMDARHTYWDNVAIESQSWMTTENDPYLYCGTESSSTNMVHAAGLAGEFTALEAASDVPDAYALGKSHPNPLAQGNVATLNYDLPEASTVTLDVFDVQGRRVAMLVHQTQEPGRYRVTWNGRADSGAALASGLYLLRLRAGTFTATEKLMLIQH